MDDSQQDQQHALISHVEDLMREADQIRNEAFGAGLSLADVWERNGLRYLGEHWADAKVADATGTIEGAGTGSRLSTNEDGTHRLVLNRTQNSVITGVAAQFERPPVIRLTPRETDDDPLWYLKPRAVKRLAMFAGGMLPTAESVFMTPDVERMQQFAQLASADGNLPTGWTKQQLVGLAPLTQQQAVEVQGALPDVRMFELTPEMLASAEPLPDLAAEMLMLVGALQESELVREDDRTRADVAQKVFDAIAERCDMEFHVIRNGLHAAVFGHQPLLFEWDADQHRPQLSNPNILNVWIDPNASSVKDAEYLVHEYLLPLARAMKAWPQYEADLKAAATSGQSPDGAFVMGRDFATDYQRNMVRVRTAWERGHWYPLSEAEAIDDGAVTLDPETGTLTLSDTGEPTDPKAANWPMRCGVRQLQVLPDINRVVFDGPCPFADIPVGWNINIPVPYTPYGLGEPQRLEDVQQAINRCVSILHNHARYYQFPMMIWPQSLVKRMEKAGVTPYAKPGRMLPVEDSIWMQMVASNGRGLTLNPPPIPGEYVDLLQILLGEHDRISGNVHVMQGETPNNKMSGVAIAQLQEAARGPLGFKSRFTQWTLEHIGRLMLDAICKWLPESEWGRIVNQVPQPVLSRMRQRILATEFDVVVEVITGKGMTRELEGRQAMEMFTAGILSRQTAMERNRVGNVEQEMQRMQQDAQQAAAVQATAAAPTQPPMAEQ